MYNTETTPQAGETGYVERSVTAIGHLLIGSSESVALRNRLLVGVSGLFGARVAFSVLSFAGSVILARLLGQSGFGYYSYAFSWIPLICVPAVLGMDQLLVRDVAACVAKSEWGRLRSLLKRAAWTVSLASVGIALAAAAAGWWLLKRQESMTVLSTFWVALLLIPLIALTRVRQAAMQGLHRVARGSLPEQVIQPGLLLLFLCGMYLFSGQRLTAPTAMALTVLSSAGAFVVGAILLSQTLPETVKNAAPESCHFSLASSALPLLCLSSIGVLFGQADTLILGAFKGAASVGAYTVAHRSADLISFVLTIQSSAFASTVSSLFALRDLDRLQRLVTRLARWTFLAALPLGIVLIGFGHKFLSLYGPQFVQARVTLAVLALCQLFNVGSGVVSLLLIMTGHERSSVTAISAAAVVNIGLTFALAPRWGAEGAAVSYAAGMLVFNLWAVIVLSRKVGIHSTVFGKLPWPKLARLSS